MSEYEYEYKLKWVIYHIIQGETEIMKEETYYGKILRKHIEKFIQKYKRIEDLKTIEEFERLFTLALVECVNDLDARIRKLEGKGK